MDPISLSSLSPYYHIIFTALAPLLSFLIFLMTRKTDSKKVRLPPGPSGWPVFGNLFQVVLSGKPFFVYVKENLIPKYGPIVTVKMGTRTLIVVSNADLAREALIEKGQVFASRPRESPTRNIFSCNKFTVNSSLYGPVWRSLRRNMVQNMLSSTRLREFRDVRDGAMDKLIDKLKAEAAENEGTVWVLKNARFAFFCILLTMCFGIEMEEEMIERVDQMLKTVLITVDPKLDDFLPPIFGALIFFKQRQRAVQVRKDQIKLILPLINRRRMALENPGSDKSATSFSYLDTLFDLHIEGRKTTPTSEELVTLCSEFLNGGTDTTGTAIEWAMARMVENPDIQTKLYHEIKSVVGSKKVDENDLQKMPYMNAFSKELMRKHSPTAFTLTHAVTEHAKLGGYDIPVGTNVDFFLAGISEDPKIWSDPEKFDPDRFLSGREDVDLTGVTGVKMLPFGIGRRICPGLSMATVHVNLMIARMVQEFEWSIHPEDGKVEFSGKLEFTVVMKNTLRAKIKPRV